MIIKQYELKKKISPKDKFFLLYGENTGLIEETIKLSLKPILPKKVFNYLSYSLIIVLIKGYTDCLCVLFEKRPKL